MSTVVRINGKEIAANVARQIAESPDLTTRELVGFVASGDAAGTSFQAMKQKFASQCGIRYRVERVPPGVSQVDFENRVAAAIRDESVGGIVIQLPLPPNLDARSILDMVPARKDPDVLGKGAYAAFLAGGNVLPPAAGSVQLILESQDFAAAGKSFAVVGQGELIGKPVSDWLTMRGSTVARLDKGFNGAELASVDCIVLGTGAYRLDPTRAKAGAGIIDFGYQGGRGDLDTSCPESLEHLAFYTPTPGGTGPVLIAALLRNFVLLNT
jgi:methylenetetrahydrofolate dehydrogenase (NADP+) / methenyltetrahydrofolate cyclohydrolase